MRPKFKFCSLPSRYRNFYFFDFKELNPPSTDTILPIYYREWAYWIKSISELGIKAFGVVYTKGKWYKWKRISPYFDRWVVPNALSNQEIEIFNYLKQYRPECLTLVIKGVLNYWEAQKDKWKLHTEARLFHHSAGIYRTKLIKPINIP
jgi:hypothetical protein